MAPKGSDEGFSTASPAFGRRPILLSADLRSRIGELTESQLVALRFASDQELAALVARVLAANMPAKDIKKAIVTWRPDTFRV